MVTKARLKLIKSLSRKKSRKEHRLFVVEGYKSILELIKSGMRYEELLITDGHKMLDHLSIEVISAKTMQSLSNVTNAPGYMGVFHMQDSKKLPKSGPIIALDDLQDPGNLGTIIRLADWYGINDIVCSLETVDAYNPKCIQASMGSIARVNLHYTDLTQFFEAAGKTVYATNMSGQSIYSEPLDKNAILLMGSESHGSKTAFLEKYTNITIPQKVDHGSTESLNVAMATSIIVSEWMRSEF